MLISPIAFPAVSKSVGILVAILSKIPFISSKDSPLAPVLVIIVSRPLSTSLKADKETAPTAVIGAVICVVKFVPISVVFSPTVFSFSPASLKPTDKDEGTFLACSSSFCRLCSVSIISR